MLGGGGLAVLGAGGLYFFTDILGGGSDADIAYGDTVEGEITPESPEDPVDGRLAEPYTFEGSSGDEVRINMQSNALDCYLILTNSDDLSVAEDDDGGSGYNSEIATVLPESDTYTIWATTYGPNFDETGPFTLSLSNAGEA